MVLIVRHAELWRRPDDHADLPIVKSKFILESWGIVFCITVNSDGEGGAREFYT